MVRATVPLAAAASDINVDDVMQLTSYVIIGFLSGVCGVVFVQLNQKWMAFRKRHAQHWMIRRKYVWSSLLISAWGLVSFPDGPFGQFLSKSQTESINDLFTNDLGPEWTFPRGHVAHGGNVRTQDPNRRPVARTACQGGHVRLSRPGRCPPR